MQVTWGEQTLWEPGSGGELGVGGEGVGMGVRGAVSARKRGVWPWAAGEVGSGEVGVLQEQRSGRASGEERGSCVSNIFNHLFLIVKYC